MKLDGPALISGIGRRDGSLGYQPPIACASACAFHPFGCVPHLATVGLRHTAAPTKGRMRMERSPAVFLVSIGRLLLGRAVEQLPVTVPAWLGHRRGLLAAETPARPSPVGRRRLLKRVAALRLVSRSYVSRQSAVIRFGHADVRC